MKNIQSIFCYNKFIVVVLLVLVMPILCSTDKNSHSIKRSKNFVSSNHLKAIHSKENTEYVAPQAPYHFNGYFDKNNDRFFIYILDSNIVMLKRGKDFYYKWLFTYEKAVESDKTVTLKNINLDEDKSIFYFSENKVECSAEKGMEHTYKSLKEKCDEDSIIKSMELNVKKATKLACVEGEESGIKYLSCDVNINGDIELEIEQSLEEINYKLNNMKIGSYSPSAEFIIKNEYSYSKLKDNKMMKVNNYDGYGFTYEAKNVTVTDNGNYTKVEYKGESGGSTYLCLAPDCEYVCIENNYDSDWYIYNNKCYKKASDFDGFFNKAFNEVYTKAKNFNPTQNNLRRSLLEEKEEEEEKNKKVKAEAAGYYKEDVQSGDYGHYKGYFLIGDELTIIEQSSTYRQHDVIQKKLVMNLDEARSVRIEEISDSDVDQTKSGVEPQYDEEETDAKCKSFIPLNKLSNPEYSVCEVSVNLFDDYTNKGYNITGTGENIQLVIYETDNEIGGTPISLTKYSGDAIQLKRIVDKISKFTNPIPADKCLKYNTTDGGNYFDSAIYNNVFYINSYDNNKEEESEELSFSISPKGNNEIYYSSDDNNVYVDIDNNKYMVYDDDYVFYHSYVGFEGENDYITCEEKLKNDALQKFADKFDEIKRKEGIDDGSVEYMMNIFLISLLLIIFI